MKILKPAAVVCALGLFFILTGTASAQYNDFGELKKVGVGFQSSFPVYGISGIYNLNEQMSGQAVIGFFGTVKIFSGRFLYKFKRQDNLNVYGYGMLGAFMHKSWVTLEGKDKTETILGLGAGVGIEYYFDGLPEIGWNAEIGFGLVDFDYYDFSAIMFGLGAHYYFDI